LLFIDIIIVRPEIPHRTGKINNLEKFDAEYFNISFNEAAVIDPMGRMLLGHTYEAIVDAGVNPKDLRGTKTGVFIGACFSESEGNWFYEKVQVHKILLMNAMVNKLVQTCCFLKNFDRWYYYISIVLYIN